MKKIVFTALLFITVTVFAQKKNLTMQDAVLGLATNLRVENLPLQWIPGENAYLENVKTSYGMAVVKNNLPALKADTIVRTTDFSDISFFPTLNWINQNQAWFQMLNKFYLWDRNTNQKQLIGEIAKDAENIFFDKNTHSVAYVLDNNLYLLKPDGSNVQITHDGKYEIVNGKSVHRDEFGINHGIFFSPKGNLLAFYRMDQSMVEDYPVIDWAPIPAVNHNVKYPFAGRTSHQVTLGVYNPQTGKTVFLKTGEPKDQYLTCVTWNPDEKSIYIAVLNRDQNHVRLNQYDVQTGELVRTLFEERDDKYVEPQKDLYFLPDGKEFLWWSQRDGFMHLYRYDLSGKLLNQVTKGDWLVNEIVGINKKKNELLITTTKDGAMEKHLYTVNWKTGKMNRIDTDPGYHNFVVNDEGTYAIDNWTNQSTPRKVDVLSVDKKFKKNLLTAADPLTGYNMPRVENLTIKAADGVTDLYGRLIYPASFDPAKKYPVVVYLYNGPHAQMNLNRFPASGNLWYDYMAQQGYVVWVMDGRGSSNRGLRFEQVIFRNLGDNEMEDQMKGVEYLKSLPFVDGERMGIHGWSYGGFMTTSFMLRKPDVFKVGVAGGPVLDWSMYEVMYGERYMDTPQSNPEGYSKNKLVGKADKLKGKLLLIHGTQDATVVWQHTVNFLRDAVSKGVQVDYFMYPGHEHNVRGKDRIHLMQKISDYFDLYLKK